MELVDDGREPKEIYHKFSFLPELLKEKLIKFYFYFRYLTSAFRTNPDFFIIGAARCGTTSLYKYLTEHPSVIEPLRKETHYFELFYNQGYRWYKLFFPSIFYKLYHKYYLKIPFITGEASADYIFHPLVPKRIISLYPKAKIIILLRNPVDRAYSYYSLNLSRKIEKESFEKVIERESNLLKKEIDKMREDEDYFSKKYYRFSYLTSGIYINQINLWKRYFPDNQILIINSEDFFKDPQNILNMVFSFLGLKDFKLNKYYKYNYGNTSKMNKKTRQCLIQFYKPFNERLYKNIKRVFDWDK